MPNKIKYVITPEIDLQIKKTYQEKVGMGSCQQGYCPVRELATRVGFPRWKISRRAQVLGLIARGKKQPVWSEKEISILEKHAHNTLEAIQRHLRRKGFSRTGWAIVLKRKRMRFLNNLNGQSACDLALCFGVDMKTVQRWIRLKYLPAAKRGTARKESQGGDAYYIKEKNIQEFIINYLDEIDIRKVDKHWFVDILTQKNFGI